jgi:hypothetical protein
MMEAKLASWLPRTIVESALIVISILLALTLDEWQEDLEIQELIDRSIVNFQNELTQNKSRIEDIGVYHRGVLQVLQRRTFVSDSESLEEFRNVMEALQPIVLTSSAWETAVATGALGRMEYELVSALTLTYNTQLRFDDDYRSTLRLLLSPINLNKENLPITTYNAGRFVTDVTSAESELSVYYAQTLELIKQFEPEN